MAATRWVDIKNKKMSPEHVARLDREVQDELLQMSLRELREEADKTQGEVASKADLTQPQISQIENRDGRMQISTLRRYVEALGGELKVVAVLGNKTITLTGV